MLRTNETINFLFYIILINEKDALSLYKQIRDAIVNRTGDPRLQKSLPSQRYLGVALLVYPNPPYWPVLS
jgi:hypothetical protein